jgi:hypothetical protein
MAVYFDTVRENVNSIEYFAFLQWIFVIVRTSHNDAFVRCGMLNKRIIEILVVHRNKNYTVINVGSLVVLVSLIAVCFRPQIVSLAGCMSVGLISGLSARLTT